MRYQLASNIAGVPGKYQTDRMYKLFGVTNFNIAVDTFVNTATEVSSNDFKKFGNSTKNI